MDRTLTCFSSSFDTSTAGVPNLAYVETVDDEKVHSFVSLSFVWKRG